MKAIVELSDEAINSILIEELLTQRDHCGDERVSLACSVLLDFYGHDLEKNQETYMYGNYEDLDSGGLIKLGE